jgi:lysophospholipase L1-like esterase
MIRNGHLLLGLLAVLGLVHPAQATPPRVAILGDSITYDGRWATEVEASLRATPQFASAEIVNFGLRSETVSGLSEEGHAGGKFPRPCLHERLDRILTRFKPTWVLACYGMNDGIYLPLDASRTKAFQEGVLKLKVAVEKEGGKIIFVTPPPHRIDKPTDDAQRYDTVLDAYSDWLVSHRTEGWQVIDIRPDLKLSIAAEKVRNPSFIYARDGIHPGEDGHHFIATSVTRQLWEIFKLAEAPAVPANAALAILGRRSELLKLAWLTRTGHTRPGVPEGLNIDQAEAQAATLMADFLKSGPALPRRF